MTIGVQLIKIGVGLRLEVQMIVYETLYRDFCMWDLYMRFFVYEVIRFFVYEIIRSFVYEIYI